MKTIWFVYPYGPLPTENALECRYARFGRILSKHGYKCVWWTANFDHGTKKRRTEGWATINVCDNFIIELVPTPSYEKNVSVERILFEIEFARNLGKKWLKIEKPDLIMTSGTGLCTAFRPVYPYMEKNNVPVIFDIMDIHMVNAYMSSHHKLLAPAAKFITSIINRKEQMFYNNVSGLCALGRNQLEVAKERTKHRSIPSCLVYNGIYLDRFKEQLKGELTCTLPEKDEEWIWCVYAGSLGPSYDIETVIRAANIAKDNKNKIRFVIAGSGPQRDQVVKASKGNDRIVYIGVLKPEQLGPVYRKCDIGLCTYADFSTVDMPDKFYDYCASGLPIINSLKGEVKEYIVDRNLGLNYVPGDPESLYSNIIKIIKSNDIEDRKARLLATAEMFDFEKLAQPLCDMIDKITC